MKTLILVTGVFLGLAVLAAVQKIVIRGNLKSAGQARLPPGKPK